MTEKTQKPGNSSHIAPPLDAWKPARVEIYIRFGRSLFRGFGKLSPHRNYALGLIVADPGLRNRQTAPTVIGGSNAVIGGGSGA